MGYGWKVRSEGAMAVSNSSDGLRHKNIGKLEVDGKSKKTRRVAQQLTPEQYHVARQKALSAFTARYG